MLMLIFLMLKRYMVYIIRLMWLLCFQLFSDGHKCKIDRLSVWNMCLISWPLPSLAMSES